MAHWACIMHTQSASLLAAMRFDPVCPCVLSVGRSIRSRKPKRPQEAPRAISRAPDPTSPPPARLPLATSKENFRDFLALHVEYLHFNDEGASLKHASQNELGISTTYLPPTRSFESRVALLRTHLQSNWLAVLLGQDT